jgi:hypothetical protein
MVGVMLVEVKAEKINRYFFSLHPKLSLLELMKPNELLTIFFHSVNKSFALMSLFHPPQFQHLGLLLLKIPLPLLLLHLHTHPHRHFEHLSLYPHLLNHLFYLSRFALLHLVILLLQPARNSVGQKV